MYPQLNKQAPHFLLDWTYSNEYNLSVICIICIWLYSFTTFCTRSRLTCRSTAAYWPGSSQGQDYTFFFYKKAREKFGEKNANEEMKSRKECL